jgi:hypothetical protein
MNLKVIIDHYHENNPLDIDHNISLHCCLDTCHKKIKKNTKRKRSIKTKRTKKNYKKKIT